MQDFLSKLLDPFDGNTFALLDRERMIGGFKFDVGGAGQLTACAPWS